MKKIIRLAVVIASALLYAAFSAPVSAQTEPKTGQRSGPIPPEVVRVAEKSCIKCHTEPGNKMAISRFNITNWDKYSPGKQAVKAKAMCKMVTKGKMPPKSFRKENPGAVLTKSDVKTICNWANSLQPPKK